MLVCRGRGTVKYTLSVDYILQEATRRSETDPLIYALERWPLEQWSSFNCRTDPEVSSPSYFMEFDISNAQRSLITYV